MCLSGRCSSCQHGDKTAKLLNPVAAFKIGDRVRLINDFALNAEAGALATVVGVHRLSVGRVHIEWDKIIPTKCPGTQQDGGYDVTSFELVVPEEPDFKALAEEFRQIAARRVVIAKTFRDKGFQLESRDFSVSNVWHPISVVKSVNYRFHKDVTITEEY